MDISQQHFCLMLIISFSILSFPQLKFMCLIQHLPIVCQHTQCHSFFFPPRGMKPKFLYKLNQFHFMVVTDLFASAGLVSFPLSILTLEISETITVSPSTKISTPNLLYLFHVQQWPPSIRPSAFWRKIVQSTVIQSYSTFFTIHITVGSNYELLEAVSFILVAQEQTFKVSTPATYVN